jgi:hypothetical protein
MGGAQKAEDAELTPIADVLAALARELEHARSVGTRVEAAFCAHAVRTELDAAVIRDMQQLDALIQQLAALRDFVSTLSGAAAGTAAIGAALERVPLGDVRARLGGGFGIAVEDEAELWSL